MSEKMEFEIKLKLKKFTQIEYSGANVINHIHNVHTSVPFKKTI